jgi:hypothetical protein
VDEEKFTNKKCYNCLCNASSLCAHLARPSYLCTSCATKLSVYILCYQALCATSCATKLSVPCQVSRSCSCSLTNGGLVCCGGLCLGFGIWCRIWGLVWCRYGTDLGFQGLKCEEGRVLGGSLHKLCLASSPLPSSLR